MVAEEVEAVVVGAGASALAIRRIYVWAEEYMDDDNDFYNRSSNVVQIVVRLFETNSCYTPMHRTFDS